ncbi:hypothetical protein GH733_001707 [Mirounga leonina]|nr:hypothetical protein GH733_001707 [Mirounga leonina]
MRKWKYQGRDACVRWQQWMAISLKLWKTEKAEQALKRRNISNISPDPASEEPAKPISLTLHEVINGAVKFLESSLHSCLQFEIVWTLTNIASGTSEQTSAHCGRGLSDCVCSQAWWVLGNTAGDNPELRDMVSSNAVPHLLTLVSSTTPMMFLWKITWTLSALCRTLKQKSPILFHLPHNHISNILLDTCWSLSYVQWLQRVLRQVFGTGSCLGWPANKQLLEFYVLTPSSHIAGNIAAGMDHQTQRPLMQACCSSW